MVKDFWQETGFIVNVEMPEAGVMETDWAENRAASPITACIRGFLGQMLDQPLLDQRARQVPHPARAGRPARHHRDLHQPPRHGGGLHLAAEREQTETRGSRARPIPDLEVEMLGRLMMRFGVEEARVKSQLAARRPPRSRARRCRSGADGAARWRWTSSSTAPGGASGLALDRVGFTVEDRDRSKGLYFVRYIDPQIDNKQGGDKGGSWFSCLKFWGSSDKPKAGAVPHRGEGLPRAAARSRCCNKDGAQEKIGDRRPHTCAALRAAS